MSVTRSEGQIKISLVELWELLLAKYQDQLPEKGHFLYGVPAFNAETKELELDWAYSSEERPATWAETPKARKQWCDQGLCSKWCDCSKSDAKAQPDDEGWIEWRGGKHRNDKPANLNDTDRVDIKLMGGKVVDRTRVMNVDWAWNGLAERHRVVAYRVQEIAAEWTDWEPNACNRVPDLDPLDYVQLELSNGQMCEAYSQYVDWGFHFATIPPYRVTRYRVLRRADSPSRRT